jgi:hypothetical protein
MRSLQCIWKANMDEDMIEEVEMANHDQGE